MVLELAIQPSPAFSDKYEVIELLGKGEQGSVYRCVRKADYQEFAVKIIDLEDKGDVDEDGEYYLLDGLDNKEVALREIEISARLAGHKHIIEFMEAFEVDHFVFLVFELWGSGDLEAYLEHHHSLPEQDVFRVMGQVFEALAFCHDMGIAHRDVCPENMLLDSDLNVKLIDLGLAIEIGEGEYLKEPCGTDGFLAPELLQPLYEEEKPVPGYRFEVDAFACGVLMYMLLSGLEPFDPSLEDCDFLVIQGNYRPMEGPEWDTVSDRAKYIVSSLLTLDPEKRLTVQSAAEMPEFAFHTIQTCC